MDGGTSSNVKLAALVSSGYHTRNHLQILGEVSLTANGGQLLDVFGRDGDHRGTRLGHHSLIFRTDAHPFQRNTLRFQIKILIDNAVCRQQNGVLYRGISHIIHLQDVGSFSQSGNGIGSVLLCQGTIVHPFQVNGGIRDRLARIIVINETPYYAILRE